jgi:HAD superfamily hydrolase (TIGR01549 family)
MAGYAGNRAPTLMLPTSGGGFSGVTHFLSTTMSRFTVATRTPDQFEHVFKQMPLGDAWAASMHFKACLAGAVAFDEVYPVLEALRPHYRLALLSNADDDFLHEALARNGLAFEITITSEQAGAIKPDPEIFHHLARVMDISEEHVLYAGDNPIPDVLGPSRAGMKSAWINRDGQRKPRKVPQPDIRVRSLAELLPLLLPHD